MVVFSGGMDSTVLLHFAVPAVASSAPVPHLPDLPASGKLALGAGGGDSAGFQPHDSVRRFQ